MVAPPGLQVYAVALVPLAVKVVLAPEQIAAGAAVGASVGVAVTFTVTVFVTGQMPPSVAVKV